MPSDLELFRDYYNNFLTLARFAEYYGLTEDKALEAITLGREEHNAIAAIGGDGS